ncbi:MAG: GNAT family N-acetyltransferase [Giesbergeria sp.]
MNSIEAFQRLVPQLTNNNPPPTLERSGCSYSETLSSTLMVARNERAEDRRRPYARRFTACRRASAPSSKMSSWISSARGQGIGEALMQRAIEIAREKGAGNISLTCNPMREAANRLYQRMGFKKRETNAYQIKL